MPSLRSPAPLALRRAPLPEHEAVFHAIKAGDASRARIAMVDLLNFALADMGVGRD